MTKAPPRARTSGRRLARLELCWALTALAPLLAQERRELPKPSEFVASLDDNLFSVSRRQEDIHGWTEALEALDKGDHVAGVERLHRLLQNEAGGVVPVAPTRFLGVRLAVTMTLANLSPAATEAYEALVRREAGNLVDRPLPELTQDQLLRLADRYPTSVAGRRARLRLADLALQSGRTHQALGHLRAALDAVPIGSRDEQRIRQRLTAANAVQRPHDFADRAVPGHDPKVAGDVLDVVATDTAPTGWRAVGGGADGATPMAEPIGQPAPQWGLEVFAPGFDREDPGLFAMHAIGDQEAIFLNTGLELVAIDPLRKEVAWESPSPLKDHAGDAWTAIRDYADGLNIHMVLAAACGGDVVVAALQVPEPGEAVRYQNHFQIINKIPERRLFAFSRSTGKLLWRHFDQMDGPLTRSYRGHSAAGPPLIVDDTVYAPVCDRAGAIAFYVGAYDLRTGQPRWRRLVCSSQQDVNMFGNARGEFAAAPLCMHDGVIYGASNLGVTFGVETLTGRCRWISSYEVIRMPPTQLHAQSDRPVYFANSAPAVVDGVLCTTPLDSGWVLAHDADDGRPLWRLPFEARVGGDNRVRWLCGAIDDEFILAGAGIVAVKARSDTDGPASRGSAWQTAEPQVRQLVRRETLAARSDVRELPRPAVSRDHVFVSLPGKVAVFDKKGNLAPVDGDLRPRGQNGNLLLVDGMAIVLRHRALDILYDAEGMRRQAEEALRADPDDPARILRLARLRKALVGDQPDAVSRRALSELYRRALDAGRRQGLPGSHPALQTAQRELYELALGDARVAMQQGSGDAVALLTAARDAAPDMGRRLEAWVMLLQALGDDRPRVLAELDRLLAGAGAEEHAFPGVGTVPVAGFVLLRRAQLRTEPPGAVLAWQELLERFPTVLFGGRTGQELAHEAIAAAIARHGDGVYAPVEERATAALAAAGTDAGQLRSLSESFPHSRAAATARTRLLDLAVEQGNLAAAIEVLAHAWRGDGPSPGVLRRVQVAATRSGNHGLAQAIRKRLQPHAALTSDFGPDAGKTFATVLAELAPPATVEPVLPQVPAAEIARIPLRAPGDRHRLIPVLTPPGFQVPPDQPLYSYEPNTTQLKAFDLDASGPSRPLLFEHKVDYLEHVLLCGRVLVIPDITRVFAVDYRSGELLWELPNLDKSIYECLGVQAGVLHLSAQNSDVGGGAEFLGIEPTTGRPLFARALTAGRQSLTPKAAGDQLLVLELASNGEPALLRLDPLSGRTMVTIPLGAATLQTLGLQADSLLSATMFPRAVCADDELVFLPIHSTGNRDAPRVAALNHAGTVVWLWTGHVDFHLEFCALRANRLVVLESHPKDRGHLSVLDARSGDRLRETTLGADIQELNWHPGWMPTPAPAALLVLDRPADRRTAPRLTCMGVDDAVQGFQYDLGPDDREGEPWPVLGKDFVAFGMRAAQNGPFRLHALRWQDRAGALPDGRKFLRLPIGQTLGMTTVGPYTVISSTEGLIILGAPDRK